MNLCDGNPYKLMANTQLSECQISGNYTSMGQDMVPPRGNLPWRRPSCNWLSWLSLAILPISWLAYSIPSWESFNFCPYSVGFFFFFLSYVFSFLFSDFPRWDYAHLHIAVTSGFLLTFHLLFHYSWHCSHLLISGNSSRIVFIVHLCVSTANHNV